MGVTIEQLLTESDLALIAADFAKTYPRAIRFELREQTVLGDGNDAFKVVEITDSEDDLGSLFEHDGDEYWATIVDGKVYGNEELDALTWEYTS